MAWVRLDLPGASVIFTDRRGGVSRPPYASANLGDHVGDDAAAVAENRRRVLASLGDGDGRPVWIGARPVHGAEVRVVDAAAVDAARVDAAGAPGAWTWEPPTVDALVTTETGAALAMLGGDCAPIALVARDGVGAVHAGWPGLAGGVVEAAVQALGRQDPSGGIVALIGPTIRACCYEFGHDHLRQVEERTGAALRARTRDGRVALDLVAGIRHALARSGVERLLDLGVCTACSPAHFSYRRDGVTGRQAVVVVRRPDGGRAPS